MRRAVLLMLFAVLMGSDAAIAADRAIPAAKRKLIDQLLEFTQAQEGTADAILDILGGRLSLPLPTEEMRGEAREGEEMGKYAEETQAVLYDRYFTQKQLRDLVTFFKSDTGQQYVKVARQMAIESRKNIQALTTKQLGEAAERSKAERTRTSPPVPLRETQHRSPSPELRRTSSARYLWRAAPRGQHYRIASAGADGTLTTASAAFSAATDDKLYGDDIVYIDGRFVHGGDPVYGQ